MLHSIPIHLPTYQLNVSGVNPHTASVDIIVCVHNALEDVQRCLKALLTHTALPYRLILIDDGSQVETQQYLQAFAAEREGVMLMRNEVACGYTLAANQGLRWSTADYVLLLNSDTVVAAYWLERLVACAESAVNIGMVGALSNTASWQSVPKIEQGGDWATNPLPEDMTVTQFANRLGGLAGRIYPRLPFLNGFCLLIKRALVQAIGYFDEETFGRGYGEENDYAIRARRAGWELAVADDVYVFHAQSKSYNHERRKILGDLAYQALLSKHGVDVLESGVAYCRDNRVMLGIRARVRVLLERWHYRSQGQFLWRGKRVVFMLPVLEVGGGANVVISEARAMRGMGVDAVILNFLHHKQTFEQSYPQLDVPVIYTPTDFDIPRFCAGFDAVIATANYSIEWLAPLADLPHPPIIAYYIQDFEPYFHVEKPAQSRWFWQSVWVRRRFASYYFRRNVEFRRAWLSYLRIPKAIFFTKTVWNQAEVSYHVKKRCVVVGSSCDIDVFAPRVERIDSKVIRISAMIRPSSSRRGALRTMQVLRKIQQLYANEVEIFTFGVAHDDAQFLALPRDFAFEHVGLLTPVQVAELFNQVDIFVDFSTFQAMGLTAMEAMGCGVAVVVPENGGTDSFAVHEKNALVVDTFSEEACLEALRRLMVDRDLRVALMRQALQDVVHFHTEGVAYRILETLFKAG